MRRIFFALVVVAGCASRDGDEHAPPAAPVTLTAASVTTPPVIEREPTLVRVLIAGDVIPHRPALADPARIGDALAPLSPLFGAADATIVNYDAATGDAARLPSKRTGFAAEPAWMSALKEAHVTGLVVANNHACDLGEAGLDATLHTASRLGIAAIGADATDPWSARIVADKHGKRVCAVAFTELTNREGCEASLAIAGANRADPDRVESAIARARTAGCDAVIAIVHAGEPDAPQGNFARRHARLAADAGADAVILHRPNAPSDVHVTTTKDGRRVPVFLSVGSLVGTPGDATTATSRAFSSKSAWKKMGVIADLVFTFDDPAARAKVNVGWGYHLTWTETDRATHRKSTGSRVVSRLIDPEGDKALLDGLARSEDGPTELFSGACFLSRRPAHCN